jgi:hypothetical protein
MLQHSKEIEKLEKALSKTNVILLEVKGRFQTVSAAEKTLPAGEYFVATLQVAVPIKTTE